ncbi:hypothetical protein DVH05_000557 [Phytophthora capsici]|nr:hypothetical protein DVH05_000557 [Phytophthora capsici]
MAFLRGRAIIIIVMGLINASTFWDVDPTNAQVMLGVLFQSILFLALGQASQIPTFMAARDIFYKQRGANFYRSSTYVLSCSVAQLPLAAGESLVFGTLILTNMAFAAWFFFVTALARGIHVSSKLEIRRRTSFQ